MRHSSVHLPDLPARAFQRDARGLIRPQGGKGGSAPSYPDPTAVANATTQTNDASAAYNKALNLNNYSNPFGSQQSTQTGTDPNTGAPIYQTNVSANPALQSNIDSLMGQAGQSGQINSSALTGLMGLNSSLSPTTAQTAQQQGQNASYAATMGYLQPQFSQQQQSLSAQLANQGISSGSTAYNNATQNLSQQQGMQQQEAINNAVLTGSQLGTQNWQNQLAGAQTQAGLYGQEASIGQTPYTDLSSMASLVPGYTGTATSSASPADISGLYNNQYQSQLAAYNANVSSGNSMMSGLFGLGSSAMMAYGMSDRRAKRAIRRIGTWKNGLGVYTYRYVWERAGRHIGFMADEVRKIAPQAVLRGADGFDRVSYVVAVR